MAEDRQPVELTRDELYRQVWETPMIKLAEKYGVTGNGLAKICDRLNVPYPPRGYWAKKAAGRNVITYRLPDAESDTPLQVTVRPTPPPVEPPVMSPEVEKQVAEAREAVAEVSVSAKLSRPHPIIANWLAERDRRKAEARQERDPDRRKWMSPGEFSASDKRRHRILDALFKIIERHGGKAIQSERHELFVELSGQRIEIQLREKQRQVRRPLSDQEKRWRSPGDKDWRQELQLTGKFAFSIKIYIPGFRKEWLETDGRPMDALLPEIIATLIAAGPVLAEREQQRKEEEHQRQIRERLRFEEEQRQKRERNRWREFNAIARQWRDTALARDFVAALKTSVTNADRQIAGRSAFEWLAWAEETANVYDPLAQGIEAIFNTVGSVTEWTQRD